MAALGWNDGTDQEIYSENELIESFSLDRVVKSSAVFDMDKLKWINGQHIRRVDREDLTPIVSEALVREGVTQAEPTAEFTATAVEAAVQSMEVGH